MSQTDLFSWASRVGYPILSVGSGYHFGTIVMGHTNGAEMEISSILKLEYTAHEINIKMIETEKKILIPV